MKKIMFGILFLLSTNCFADCFTLYGQTFCSADTPQQSYTPPPQYYYPPQQGYAPPPQNYYQPQTVIIQQPQGVFQGNPNFQRYQYDTGRLVK